MTAGRLLLLLILVLFAAGGTATPLLLPMGLGSTLRFVAAGVAGVGAAAEVLEHPVSVRLLPLPVLCAVGSSGATLGPMSAVTRLGASADG